MTHTGVFFRPLAAPDDARVCLIGLPWDGTVSNRPGARFGPDAIRSATLGVEDYSPYLDRDIGDLAVADIGDLELPWGDTEATLTAIREAVDTVLDAGARPVGLGGEHLVSLPLIEAAYARYGDDLFIVHFDAHADLRPDYLGVALSHATVMHRVSALIGRDRTATIGIRSGTAAEWAILRSDPHRFAGPGGASPEAFARLVADRIVAQKVYITLDLDVFDPGIMPGTGTPEPGGLSFPEFAAYLAPLRRCEIVGADIVELAPHYDTSGISSALAATALRELLMMMGEGLG